VYYGNPGYSRIGYDALNSKTILLTTGDYDYALDPVTPTWTRLTTTYPANDYPSYGYATVTYDPSRSALVVYSGQAYTRKLWEFTSADGIWTDRSTATNGPIQRTGPALAYDTKRGKLMLFGGHSSVDNLNKQDIWE